LLIVVGVEEAHCDRELVEAEEEPNHVEFDQEAEEEQSRSLSHASAEDLAASEQLGPVEEVDRLPVWADLKPSAEGRTQVGPSSVGTEHHIQLEVQVAGIYTPAEVLRTEAEAGPEPAEAAYEAVVEAEAAELHSWPVRDPFVKDRPEGPSYQLAVGVHIPAEVGAEDPFLVHHSLPVGVALVQEGLEVHVLEACPHQVGLPSPTMRSDC
jgi:hypothetical protein